MIASFFSRSKKLPVRDGFIENFLTDLFKSLIVRLLPSVRPCRWIIGAELGDSLAPHRRPFRLISYFNAYRNIDIDVLHRFVLRKSARPIADAGDGRFDKDIRIGTIGDLQRTIAHKFIGDGVGQCFGDAEL